MQSSTVEPASRNSTVVAVAMAQHTRKALNAEVADLLSKGYRYLDVRYVSVAEQGMHYIGHSQHHPVGQNGSTHASTVCCWDTGNSCKLSSASLRHFHNAHS